MTFGKYSANGRDRPVTLQFKFFPTAIEQNMAHFTFITLQTSYVAPLHSYLLVYKLYITMFSRVCSYVSRVYSYVSRMY